MTDEDTAPSEGEPAFGRDIGEWLAERGIERDPIRVRTDGGPDGRQKQGASSQPASTARPDERPASAASTGAPASAQEGQGVGSPDEADETVAPPRRGLEEEVAEAVAYARRSTAQAPKSESKLADAMRRKGFAGVVVDQAIERCRKTGIVDDAAYAGALVDEGLAKGHAPLRLRKDLEKRGLPKSIIDDAVERARDRDLEARAYDLAAKKAGQSRGVDDETAFRRIVGYLARRGYTQAIARRVARQAVFNDREPQRTAER